MLKSALLATCLAAASLSACVTQPAPTTQSRAPVVTEFASNTDFTATALRLENAIQARGLTMFTAVDHAGGALKVGQTLAPNRLYIFGNPQAGTPLMQANPALGIDLPLKAQVREENGVVLVTVSDIRALTAAKGVYEPAPVITKIEETLTAIGIEAAGG